MLVAWRKHLTAFTPLTQRTVRLYLQTAPQYDYSQYEDSLLFVWLLTFGLPGEVEPTGTVVPASIALRVIAALKPDHHVKVAAIGREEIQQKGKK